MKLGEIEYVKIEPDGKVEAVKAEVDSKIEAIDILKELKGKREHAIISKSDKIF